MTASDIMMTAMIAIAVINPMVSVSARYNGTYQMANPMGMHINQPMNGRSLSGNSLSVSLISLSNS